MRCRLSWFLGPEYHHQLEAFADASGFPEYWLNHPDSTVHPGNYGPHFDCNAFILRQWPTTDWFWSNYAKVIAADDADADGLPDSDPRLSTDEAKLGSAPGGGDTE